MERLTLRSRNSVHIARETDPLDVICSNYCTRCGARNECEHINRCLHKLANYEDTNLTPAEAAELAQAKREGRLLLMPVAEGTRVYTHIPDCDSCDSLETAECGEIPCLYDVTEAIFSRMMIERWGLDIFATREEAASALEGMKGANTI